MMFNKEIAIVIFLKKNKNTKSVGDSRSHDSTHSLLTVSLIIAKDIGIISSVSSQSSPSVRIMSKSVPLPRALVRK